MDMLEFLKAKAARCRDLARLHDGEKARELLKIAAGLDQEAIRWRRPVLNAHRGRAA